MSGAPGPRTEAVEAAQPGVPAELAGYRATIDNLDAALVHLLAERFRCTQQVGMLKARLNLPPSDPGREERQVTRLRALAEDSGLDPVFAEKFFAFIVEEVIRHHEAIRTEQAGEHTAGQAGA
ncbi:MAG: chorismate mutase [Actinomyces urogenitalis]|uniref:Chorismate mutase n=1 Tax=Actinomyces urogenitalis TaxID=103621 RepID=A0A2I1KTV5_9ACTO|nr:chorismate mutase [Actinomyces urogenitalis]MBS5977493.1 chorismate mutase [Actinomyces urogenitalis]MBS6072346.1 chorismate mutase [Actinomyces urogenitalis]MDK8236853.1 chorismate mutase [Actinomyces urogenitalis]MDU0864698.1 chorismate mutase [Actinomyces urogenitalis]MDU0875244.1 chorismate mutase [Actinomyces urogenitalis]